MALFGPYQLGVERSGGSSLGWANQRDHKPVEACAFFDSSPASCTASCRVGRRMKKWNEKWNFSQIPQIYGIVRIFLAFFLKISRHFIISWPFLWNSGKIFSGKISLNFRRKIARFIERREWISMKWNFIFSFRQKCWRRFAEILRSERCKGMQIL